MSEIVTLLDAAHAALSADPENDALRLRFFERLADGELFLLLDREADGRDGAETLEPRIFPLEMGPVVLVFDREERLAVMQDRLGREDRLVMLVRRGDVVLARNIGGGQDGEDAGRGFDC